MNHWSPISGIFFCCRRQNCKCQPPNSFVLSSGDEWHLWCSLFLAPCSSLPDTPQSWFAGICMCGCPSTSQRVWSSQLVCVSCYYTFYLSNHLNFFSLCFMLLKLLQHTLAQPTPRVLYSDLKTVKTFDCWEMHLHRSHMYTCLRSELPFLQAIFLRLFILEARDSVSLQNKGKVC